MGPPTYYPNYYTTAQAQHTPSQTNYSYTTQPNNSLSTQYAQVFTPSTAPTSAAYVTYQADPYAQPATSYTKRQTDQWNGGYAAESDRGSHGRAAEALRSLSSVAYSTNTTPSVSSPGLAPSSTSGSRYKGSQPEAHQTSYRSSANQSQRPARPKSVNNVRSNQISNHTSSHSLPMPVSAYPSQHTKPTASPQPSPSSAQSQYAQNTLNYIPPPTAGQTTQQYTNYNNGALHSASDTPHEPASTSYTYTDRQPIGMSGPTTSRTTGHSYDPADGTVTVDPAAIYDPWPEWQRKLEAERAAKAAEEARRAEEEAQRAEEEAQRVEEEARRAEEDARRAEEDARKAEEDARKAAEEARRKEDDRRLEEQRRNEQTRAENQRKMEEGRQALESRAAATSAPVSQQVDAPGSAAKDGKPKKPRKRKSNATGKDNSADGKGAPLGNGGDDLEEQIRAMMLKMREFNSKDPALLARIWEQERRAHLSSQGSQPPNAPAPETTAPEENKAIKGKGTAKTAKAAPQVSQAFVTKRAKAGADVQPTQVQTQPTSGVKSPAPAPTRPPSVPPAKSQSTIWPPEKKVHLAAAASKWLNAFPENRGKVIAPDEINRMLDSNPSYIELCERLEAKGLKMERSNFAKALLAAVPDVASSSRSARSPQIQQLGVTPTHTEHQTQPQVDNRSASSQHLGGASLKTMAPPKTNDSDATNPQPLGNTSQGVVAYQAPHYQPARENGNEKYPPPQAADWHSPYFHQGFNVYSAPPSLPGQTAPVAPMEPPKEQHKPPPPPPKPKTKEEAARKRSFNDLVDLTALSDDDLPPPPKKVNLDIIDRPSPVASSTTTVPLPSSVAQQPGSFNTHNSYYITSKLPQTNGSFEQPPQAFGQPAAPNSFRPPSTVDSRLSENPEIVKPIHKKKALRRSTYNIKTIARDVLLATGKHPDMRPLNGHLEPLRSQFRYIDVNSDLSTFRWDLVDPGTPSKQELQELYQRDIHDADADADDEEEALNPPPRPAVQNPVSVGNTVDPSRGDATPPPVKVPKRRGRPPRKSYPVFASHASDASTADIRSRAQKAEMSTPCAVPAKATVPTSAPTGIGYSQFRQFAADGTPIKKKGRPVGWRKAIHGSAAAKVNIGQSGELSGLRNVAGPTVVIDSRSPSAAPAQQYSVFKCLWRDCSAQLHNLDTLRKHVQKLHGKPTAIGAYNCHWENCGRDAVVGDHVERKPLFFSTLHEWRVHLEQSHLLPLAWSLGDGPASGLSDGQESEAYLSDAYGRRVTPHVTVLLSDDESSSKKWTHAGTHPPPPRGPGRPKKTDEEQAKDALQALTNKKKEVGPGLDRGGSRLANDKRRLGFVDDEDMGEIVNRGE